MADNVELNAGTGGSTLATDDIAGIHYQIGKTAFGALDSATLAASGAGAVSAGVQRVTLASDDPAVTALQVLDNAISGTEMQVDVVAALPAGNNNIGDVDVASVVAGTGATNLGKAEDAVHSTGDTGVYVLAVRDDTLGAHSGTDGDYESLHTDAAGALWVRHTADAVTVASHAVTNAGTFAVQVDGSALTALQLIDNLVLAEDAAHVSADPGVQMLAVRKATPANVSGTDGDYEPLQVSGGRLWVDPSGVTLTVGSHAVTNAGTFAVQVDAAIPAGNNNIGDVDIASIAAGDNNIGNVDIVSGTITTVSSLGAGTTGPQKAEDAASANTDVGIPAMAVQKATPANTAGTDGDYEFLQMSAGRLWASATIDAALPAGANAIGKLAANSGVDIGDVDVTSISAGTNLIGDVGLQGRTTGGLSFYKSIDLDETEEEVKATAGTLYSILAFNRTAAPLYLKIYNATAANVIVGTTVPDMTLVVPANADSDGAGFTHSVAQGYAFGTAITIAATTGVADNDTGAPGANDCVVLVGYK